jgi:hypothetical protein
MTMTNRDWSLHQRPLSTARAAALSVFVLGTALLSGALAAGKTEALLGAKPTRLLLATLVGSAFLIVFAFLGSTALLIWPVAATGGYLLQIPRDHPVFTFDRAWIGGLIAYIALTPRPSERTPTTRLLRFALLSFVLVWAAPRWQQALPTTGLSIDGSTRSCFPRFFSLRASATACREPNAYGAWRACS